MCDLDTSDQHHLPDRQPSLGPLQLIKDLHDKQQGGIDKQLTSATDTIQNRLGNCKSYKNHIHIVFPLVPWERSWQDYYLCKGGPGFLHFVLSCEDKVTHLCWKGLQRRSSSPTMLLRALSNPALNISRDGICQLSGPPLAVPHHPDSCFLLHIGVRWNFSNFKKIINKQQLNIPCIFAFLLKQFFLVWTTNRNCHMVFL